MKIVSIVSFFALLLAFAGCDDESSPVSADNHLKDLLADGASHFTSGPFDTVTVGVDTGSAAEVESHHSVLINLADYNGQKGGFVHLVIGGEHSHAALGSQSLAKTLDEDHAHEHIDILVGMNKNVPVTITDISGDTLELEVDSTNTDFARFVIFEGHADESEFVMIIGPTSETNVSVVLVPEEGEHYHEEDGHDH